MVCCVSLELASQGHAHSRGAGAGVRPAGSPEAAATPVMQTQTREHKSLVLAEV